MFGTLFLATFMIINMLKSKGPSIFVYSL